MGGKRRERDKKGGSTKKRTDQAVKCLANTKMAKNEKKKRREQGSTTSFTVTLEKMVHMGGKER